MKYNFDSSGWLTRMLKPNFGPPKRLNFRTMQTVSCITYILIVLNHVHLLGWKSFSRKEKSLILQIVSLISANDFICGANLLPRFSDEIQSPEARCFLGFMIMQKNIHSELFTVLLDLFADSEQQRDDMLEAVCHSRNIENFEKFNNEFSAKYWFEAGLG